jgi:hypothetical protein
MTLQPGGKYYSVLQNIEAGKGRVLIDQKLARSPEFFISPAF